MFPLAGSSPASPGQAPPLVLLLLLPLADRWRDESHGTVRHSRWVPTHPFLADTLTACPAASATCSGASASPCRSSAARLAGCGTPPPWRPAGPQTSCSRAEGGQGRQQVLSNCLYFWSVGVGRRSTSFSPVPPSSASSCISCWGPVFAAGQYATAAQWPPAGPACRPPADSPGPPTSPLQFKDFFIFTPKGLC